MRRRARDSDRGASSAAPVALPPMRAQWPTKTTGQPRQSCKPYTEPPALERVFINEYTHNAQRFVGPGGSRLMSLFRAVLFGSALLISETSLAGNEPSSVTAFRKDIVP